MLVPFTLVKYLQIEPERTQVEQGFTSECMPPGQTLKYWTRLKRLAWDKHSSLVPRSINEEEKHFHNVDTN
jgi:hypothetical protein